MNNSNLILIIIFVVLIAGIYFYCRQTENLCIKRSYGYVTDVPVSDYVDANMALVHSTSLGSQPLGDPLYWVPNRSPITQGQYGLYQTKTLTLAETQPFDRSTLSKQAGRPVPPAGLQFGPN